MIKQDGYYYDHQLTTYVRQFMAIFTGLQVQVGKWQDQEERLISVPIAYGAKDRVVASIMAENTQNKPLRLPMLSAYVRNMRKDPSRMAGTGVQRRNTYTPVGGAVPDDTRVIHQRRAIPYVLDMELSIYVSNTDQHFQILENLLPIFDPELTIPTSDAIFDMKRLTSVILTSINFEQPYPSATNPRLIQSTLHFDLPIWIDTPAEVRKDFIEKVFVRIGAVSSGAVTHQQMIDDLDNQGLPYQLWADGSDVKLD